jgi:hypothetical protein
MSVIGGVVLASDCGEGIEKLWELPEGYEEFAGSSRNGTTIRDGVVAGLTGKGLYFANAKDGAILREYDIQNGYGMYWGRYYALS